MNLSLSLIALFVGPLLYGLCRSAEASRSLLDGFLFVTIAGIVVVHIVPDVFGITGPTVFAFLILGIIFALTVDRFPATGDHSPYSGVVVVGAIGLVIHAAMDGIALLPDSHIHGTGAEDLHGINHAHEGAHSEGLAALFNNHLALAVILHRIPVGMAIWWTLRPRLGSAVAVAALAIIGAGTALPYWLGEPVFDLLKTGELAYFQAFVAGALLHVIVTPSARQSAQRLGDSMNSSLISERLGVIAGLLVIFMVPHAH